MGAEHHVTPRAFAIAYFVSLLAFAEICDWTPDTDFYHQSIQHKPNSVAHLRALTDGLDGAWLWHNIGIRELPACHTSIRLLSPLENSDRTSSALWRSTTYSRFKNQRERSA